MSEVINSCLLGESDIDLLGFHEGHPRVQKLHQHQSYHHRHHAAQRSMNNQIK